MSVKKNVSRKKDGAKEVKAMINLHIKAGSANPSPPVGPALGRYGLNIMEFCKAFNEATKDLKKTMRVPVSIKLFKDGKYVFTHKYCVTSDLIKDKLGITKGSGTNLQNKVAQISKQDLMEIAEIKMKDLSAASLEAAWKTVKGSAESMGVEVIDE